ncbi:hypothetical protein KHA96_17875 [Bacillus sp. FJAT-49711]|uniref:phosphotransferase n=1 Tax=Bacillus sp. FJAT-49711 TaxID=2833585 RepID=UPI001BC9BC73|nr:phosphotransferase [Bacillus sp. FJAT-49711]MBS4220173.1 hypothetical protein [Bacillus sp. FJAT-49711]
MIISKTKKCKEKKDYTYVFVDDLIYINLDQGLLILMYYLFFKGKPLEFLERKTRNNVINCFLPLVRGLRVLQFTYLFYKKRRIYRKSEDSVRIITTSFFGNCLILLRLGEYKVINFRKKDVTTVFPNNNSIADIKESIDKCIKAQKCNLAPNIISWDINKRFIKERYLNLKTLFIELDNADEFNIEIFPILENIVLSTPPQDIILRNYQQKLVGNIDFFIKKYLNQNLDNNENKIILGFLSFINEELTIFSSKKEIQLFFSHGDLWEQNILKNNKGLGVIDWNTLDMRSLYFDFFYIMFHKVSRQNEDKRINTIKEIDMAFENFQFRLIENDQFNSKSVLGIKNHLDLYRYLFYLEFVLLRLQEYPKRGKRDLNFLITWIDFFKLYEVNNKENASSYII